MANSPARSAVDVGSVIADTYKIEALIGRGGMGSVFLASHARLPGKQVAIKLLHAEVQDDEVLARFRREAEIASRLGHPNIVAVHDFNVTPDGMPYLVLEYLQGETLAQRLKDGPPPLDQTMSIIRQVGSALAAAHREGIVHRDLKPHNIFLVSTEVDGHLVEIAKVLDFGISKIRGSQTVKTQETALLGTPQYMAPEQAMGQHASVDERTDVFALGAIVHEMLTGHPAFTGASIPEVVFKVVYEKPAELPDTVPANIVAVVKRAMAKPLAERFATVGAFVEALTGQPLTQLRPTLSAAPEVGFANGSQNVSNHAALANTMGSVGDPTSAAPVSGDASTVASVSSRKTTAGAEIELAHTMTSGAKPALPPPARKLWPLVAVGVGAIGATAAVMLFVIGGPDDGGTRDKSDRRTATTDRRRDEAKPADRAPPRREIRDPDRVDPKAGDPNPADPRGTDPKPTEPADPTHAGGSSDPKPTDAKPTDPTSTDPKPTDPKSKQSGRTTTQPEDGGNAELRDVLAEAEAAWARGERAEALRLTSRVVNEGGDSRVAAEAHVLRGTILCNDITLANGELRSIRVPALAKKLRAKCPTLQ